MKGWIPTAVQLFFRGGKRKSFTRGQLRAQTRRNEIDKTEQELERGGGSWGVTSSSLGKLRCG